MTARGQQAAALALHRFGLGPRRDSIAGIAADPRGALLAELDRPDAGSISPGLSSSGEAARAVFRFRAEEQAKLKLVQRAKTMAAAADGSSPFDCKKPLAGEACAAPLVENQAENQQKPRQPPLPQQLILNEAKARFDAATNADIGFRRTAGVVLVQSFLHFGRQDTCDGRRL